jgi:uncharacterized protein YkwD
MSAIENQLKQYRIGLIVSGVLNVVLVGLLLVNRGSGGATAVSPTLQVAAVPSATSQQPTTTAAATEIAPTPTAEIAEPTPTATQPATATLLPTLEATAVPTQPPTPTATLQPTAAATATAVPGPDWLRYYNQFRTQSGLPQLAENSAWSAGSLAHSQYMMTNSLSAHAQDPNKPGYSPQGDEAGQNSNIAISGWDGASDLWAIDYWMSAPFHAVPMLNPHLSQTGFGVFRDASNSFKMTATLDVSSKRPLGQLPESITFPILYPRDGGEIWVLRYTLPEFPNPLTACSGLQKPLGPRPHRAAWRRQPGAQRHPNLAHQQRRHHHPPLRHRRDALRQQQRIPAAGRAHYFGQARRHRADPGTAVYRRRNLQRQHHGEWRND